jgi:hypothetical protein
MTLAQEAQRYLAVVELLRAELSNSSPSAYTQDRDRRKSCSN